MFKRLFGIFVAYLFLSITLGAKVIVTHGAFGDDMDWYKPGGYFYEALIPAAKMMDEEVISFTWKQYLGGVTHKERLNAAKDLAKLIIDITNEGDNEIILIGHSYGGHVIKAASQFLAVAQGLQDANKPIIVLDRNFDQKNLGDWDQKYYEDACAQVKAYKDLKLSNKSLKKDFLIDEAYILATPINTADYLANMYVIQFLFNMFSNGDLIQDLVGDRLLPEPKHERAVNLEVKIKKTGLFGLFNKPGHIQMHAEIIAKWILYIPFYLMTEKDSGFDKFSFEKNGVIQFADGRLPKYSYAKRRFFESFDFLSFSWIKDKLGIK